MTKYVLRFENVKSVNSDKINFGKLHLNRLNKTRKIEMAFEQRENRKMFISVTLIW